ncbi:hypothetical protein CK203_042357 [Vitis vinifera]|uniref:Uncharacterized protein n=1 Tax=Vitis vinifera TaxID=29760 RepID=A0A438H587_VITVI|nr:hypothetical protein CK203_042357 [Vitis vinifera]
MALSPDTARIVATMSRAFHPNHTDIRQMAPDYLSGRYSPASLKVPFAT